MMKRAILTGATGAIGMALICELIQNNVEMLIFCRDGSVRNSNIPVHPLVTLQYCSLEQLESLQNDTGKEYDVLYHFAWDGTMGDARNDMYLQNKNVKYTCRWCGGTLWLQDFHWGRLPGGVWKSGGHFTRKYAGISGKWIWNGKALRRTDEQGIVRTKGNQAYLDEDPEHLRPL